jgi:hypothetical protein
LSAALSRIAALEAQVEQLPVPGLTAWPTPDTVAQGFLAGRWQRRDGNIYQQPLANIPEAPSDSNYYGRYQLTWQPVVEEAPALTARRSAAGWARASAGSDVTWLNLDDILVNYQPAGNYAPAGNYLSRDGGQMNGPLIARDGGSATNPGLAIGENSTGFWRTSGNLLVTSVAGVVVTQIQPALAAFFVQVNFTGKALAAVGDPLAGDDALNLRTAEARYMPADAGLRLDGGTMSGPLNMGNHLITAVGDPVAANDALNLRTADARYLRAKPVVYDIAADILVPASGAWTLIATVPITLPSRPGVTSLLMVSVNCNLKGVNNVNGIGVRIPISPTPDQRVFGFGPSATDLSAGFSVNFFVSPGAGATTFSVPVQMNAFPLTGTAPDAYTVVGGNALVLDRSQIVVTDLGPA